MQALQPELRTPAPEEVSAREEAKINRVVWGSRVIGVVVALGAVAFMVLTQADEPWQYVAYPSVAGAILAYVLVTAHHMRLMHVALLRRYQAQVMIRAAELQEMASRDELTRLYNRRHFYERIQEELDRARSTRQPLALLLLDVDGLKGINDDYGHQAGDAVIANLGKVVAKHTRNSDVSARLGGDEFAVIMPDTDKRGAFALAQRLWEELEQTPMFEREEKRIMVSISIGVSGFPWGGEDVDEMMHWADADMYANKASHRLPTQATSAGDSSTDTATALDDYGF